jgi:phage FluMu protein Com
LGGNANVKSGENMNINESENDKELLSEFKQKRGREIILDILTIIFFISLFVLNNLFHIPYWLFLLAIVIRVSYSFLNWRCPNCESYLGGWGIQISAIFTPSYFHCPHCGKLLRSINTSIYKEE